MQCGLFIKWRDDYKRDHKTTSRCKILTGYCGNDPLWRCRQMPMPRDKGVNRILDLLSSLDSATRSLATAQASARSLASLG